jgi:hypothetical protein
MESAVYLREGLDDLEDPDVLLETGERDVQRLRQLADRRRAPTEPLQDVAASRIGKGREGGIECVAILTIRVLWSSTDAMRWP